MNNLFQYTGLNALPVDSISPGLIVNQKRTPLPTDWQNQQVGNFWLYTNPNTNVQSLWVLVSLYNNQATWIELTGGSGVILGLTGNSGGEVFPLLGNINIVGDGTTINVVGVPATHTLTISAVGTGVVSSLTGNSGGAVFPTSNNTNILGTGVISVVGNPGTSTLTITPSGAIASSFITNPATGTATPAAGVLTFAGTGDVTVSAAGSTITINGSGSGTVTTLHTDDTHNVTATAGVINIAGGTGIVTTGTIGPNTVTISGSSAIPLVFHTDSGDATPAANAISVLGAGGTTTSGAGSTITITSSGGGLTGNTAFSAGGNNHGNVTGDGTVYTVTWESESFDIGNNFASNTFTATIAGIYRFTTYIHADGALGSTGQMNIVTSGGNIPGIGGAGTGTAIPTCFASGLVQLGIGGTAIVQVVGSGGAKTQAVQGIQFCGELVSD